MRLQLGADCAQTLIRVNLRPIFTGDLIDGLCPIFFFTQLCQRNAASIRTAC